MLIVRAVVHPSLSRWCALARCDVRGELRQAADRTSFTEQPDAPDLAHKVRTWRTRSRVRGRHKGLVSAHRQLDSPGGAMSQATLTLPFAGSTVHVWPASPGASLACMGPRRVRRRHQVRRIGVVLVGFALVIAACGSSTASTNAGQPTNGTGNPTTGGGAAQSKAPAEVTPGLCALLSPP